MKRNAQELMTFVFDTIGQIAALRNHETLFIELAKFARDIVFADRCSIWIYDHKNQKVWTKVAQGVASIVLDEGVGIVGYAIDKNSPLIINDVQSDKRFNPEVDIKTGYITKTMMVIPMQNQYNQTIGAIQVINKKENEFFNESDLKYLTLASTYVAESIQTILLMEEIEETQREFIYIMGATGEKRSKETGYHVKRVAEYSYLLAKLYGLNIEECDALRLVSPMHDIGKIGIPDAILNKPARLDPSEWEVMKQHAQIGYDILKNSDLRLLQASAIVAYEHHEKWDGSGYPIGFKGEEIHIYGRITALADVFDALGSERIYKPAWSDEKIFALFEEERGKHFEPKLVDLFFANKEKFFEIRERLKDV